MRLPAVGLVTLLMAAVAPGDDLKVGEVVPDVAMKAYDGKEYKLSDYRENKDKKIEGQVVVVYFQSEFCPYAIDPSIVSRIVEPWNDPKAGVKFISIFTDSGDTEKAIKKFIEKRKLTYTCVWEPENRLRDHFGAKKVNHTFVLDKSGKLIYRGGFAEMEGTKKVLRETVVEAVKAAKEGADVPKGDR